MAEESAKSANESGKSVGNDEKSSVTGIFSSNTERKIAVYSALLTLFEFSYRMIMVILEHLESILGLMEPESARIVHTIRLVLERSPMRTIFLTIIIIHEVVKRRTNE